MSSKRRHFPILNQILQMVRLNPDPDKLYAKDVTQLWEEFWKQKSAKRSQVIVLHRKIVEKALTKDMELALYIIAQYFIKILQTPSFGKLSYWDIFSDFVNELLNGQPFGQNVDLEEMVVQRRYCQKYFMYFVTETIFVPEFPINKTDFNKSQVTYLKTLAKNFSFAEESFTTLKSSSVDGVLARVLKLHLKEKINAKDPPCILFADAKNFAIFCQQSRKVLSSSVVSKFFCLTKARVKKIADIDFIEIMLALIRYKNILEQDEDKFLHQPKIGLYIKNNLSSSMPSLCSLMKKIYIQHKNYKTVYHFDCDLDFDK